MGKPNILPLPDRNDKNYHAAVIANVIEAYKVFLSDSMSLDYCGVAGKYRALILEDKEYQRAVKVIRAEKYLEEIDEIEVLSADLKNTEAFSTTYDFRDTKQKKQQMDKDYKDIFGMRLRIAEMRRDLLNMSNKENEREDQQALNIFFVPLSREEFEKMKSVEINYGEELAKDAFSDEQADSMPAKLVAQSAQADLAEADLEGGYLQKADGTAEDF